MWGWLTLIPLNWNTLGRAGPRLCGCQREMSFSPDSLGGTCSRPWPRLRGQWRTEGSPGPCTRREGGVGESRAGLRRQQMFQLCFLLPKPSSQPLPWQPSYSVCQPALHGLHGMGTGFHLNPTDRRESTEEGRGLALCQILSSLVLCGSHDSIPCLISAPTGPTQFWDLMLGQDLQAP